MNFNSLAVASCEVKKLENKICQRRRNIKREIDEQLDAKYEALQVTGMVKRLKGFNNQPFTSEKSV
jgi:hypothetical protein